MFLLPLAVHTAEQVRALDRHAIDALKIPGYTLMTRAGEAALRAIQDSWPSAHRLVIVCGPGNNGGDGYVLARLARERHLDVSAVCLSPAAELRGDAARAYGDFAKAGGHAMPWSDDVLRDADVIVDAMFGTGLSRPLDGASTAIVEAINASRAPVLALDIPSGLHADSGAVLGAAVRAHCTLTFIGLKLGFYVGRGPDYVGRLRFDPLGLDEIALAQVPPRARRIDERELGEALPPRPRTAHKGLHGDVLIIGGGIGMAGAAHLAGEAALRCGAGRVTVATHPQNVSAVVGARPELMCRGIREASELKVLIERADVLAIGPGLGQDEWSKQMLQGVMQSQRPAVLDADALNLLDGSPTRRDEAAPWILTPHPGEAARLLGVRTQEVQADRLEAARLIAQRYASVVVLKGAGSIVTSPEGLPHICDRGNPGMASPGMGDVLTGVIAAILAQLADPVRAARVGVLVHAMAGDLAASKGERGMIASDLFEHLPSCVNPTRSY
jgi:NAD(P)H-hydrate epimerase